MNFMKKLIFLILISFYSCGNQNKENLQLGKYYAAHGFKNEYIVLFSDSTYLHCVGEIDYFDTAKYVTTKEKIYLDFFVEKVNYETGSVIPTNLKGTRGYTYSDGVLSIGLEPLNFIHEERWDTACHCEK